MIKLLSIIFLLGGTLFSSCIFPNQNLQEKQMQDPTPKETLSIQDSVNWFEKYLDIYIEKHLFTFNPAKYVYEPTEEIKKELSLDYWLGNFTISDMTSDKDLITVDCSNSERGFNKFVYITPDVLIITFYTTSKNGIQNGSSLVYDPSKNTLDKLEGIILKK